MSQQQGQYVSLPRILITDDHPEIITVVKQQMNNMASIVGSAHDGAAMLQTAEALKPDVVFLDISMPDMNGFEAAHRLLALMPQMRIIFLTMHDRPSYVREAFRLGARGYVLKSSAGELPTAIDRVMQGGRFLSSTLRAAHPELILATPSI
ncbi:MAG: response regulator transcription factor [Nitrospira sp.]